MKTQFFCMSEDRRRVVREQADPKQFNGIDYLEVSSDQLMLRVHFMHHLPGQADPVPPAQPVLTKDNIVIEGGVRETDVQVVAFSVHHNVLTVTVSKPGDFSIYTLRLVQSPTRRQPPRGYDPQLSTIEFSFKVDCPSDFDCAPVDECLPEKLPEPEIDYLAKDYASFRRLMLDRLTTLMPDWQERNPADLQVVLVELLAYVGDHLSYFQDAVATEAHLGTARRRTSVRRHARLLDYFMHDGCNARTWVCFEVQPGSTLDGSLVSLGTPLLTRGSLDAPMIDPNKLHEALAERPLIFETKQNLTLHSAHNCIRFYTWSDFECCLPRGATHATLQYEAAAPLDLVVGQVLIFEEVISPTTGEEADADRSHRHAVCLTGVADRDPLSNPLTDPLTGTQLVEIEWSEDDALPFPLCLSAIVRSEFENKVLSDVSVARGNIVLADHGQTIKDEPLVPEKAPDESEPYRPHLRERGLTFAGPLNSRSAFAMMQWDVSEARPSVTLEGDGLTWAPQYDLLASDGFRVEFVVELELDNVAHLRFGDDLLGRQPSEGAAFTATYRVGNGRIGNVSAEAISHIVLWGSGIERLRNPLAASGGMDPELIEEVRQYAPQAFRTQQRAVTADDWAEIVQRRADIQRAVANVRWTGSWYTVFITVDRRGGRPVDAGFEENLRAYLERFRIAGYDLEVNAPISVPLDISLRVFVKPHNFRSDVKRSLLRVFSAQALPSGALGFFHPDNLTFGQPVYLSQLVETAMSVTGVASVEVVRFQRLGKAPNHEIENSVLAVGALEVVQLANDPNFPENGKIDFQMEGGL